MYTWLQNSDGNSGAVSWCTAVEIVSWRLSTVQFEVWQLVVSAVWILELTVKLSVEAVGLYT